MKHRLGWRGIGLLGSFWLASGVAHASPPKSNVASPPHAGRGATPAPARLVIEGVPLGGIVLSGPEATWRPAVARRAADGRTEPVRSGYTITVSPPAVATVTPDGRLKPLREGRAIVRLRVPGVPPSDTALRVVDLKAPPRVSFRQQIVPLLATHGCSGGTCHGKSGGQGGFSLSLFGFEPGEDLPALRAGGRIDPARPEQSAILRKATLEVPHRGGKRFDRSSSAYRVLVRWIREGAEMDPPSAPRVERIEMLPVRDSLQRGQHRPLAVVAHRSDGSAVDVTELAQWESNDDALAEASPEGWVTAGERAGVAAVMARYQTHVAVSQLLVPASSPRHGKQGGTPVGPARPSDPTPASSLDRLLEQQWRRLGLIPAALADDGTFLRRVTLDLTGRLPSLAELEAFAADRTPGRDRRLIDRLLGSAEYADFWAMKWNALLRNRRASPRDDPQQTIPFHGWIRRSLAENKPYDRFVREILTAVGDVASRPEAGWYREVREVDAQVEDTAQLFLGQRIACARCHHHPQERWSQRDYHGMAAFFSRLTVVDPPAPKAVKGQPAPVKPPLAVSFRWGKTEAKHPRTGETIHPTPLLASAIRIEDEDDARAHLASWMTRPDNPFFARALVNRYWKHFLGRGLVEPEDDLRVTNPATHPELLDALAAGFSASGYDLKQLIREICSTRAYRLSAHPAVGMAPDVQNYSRFIPRRLPAEALLDAIDTLTGETTTFRGMPVGTRAVQLPDAQFESHFLGLFGRPEAATACECERSSGASLAQAVHMLNSPEILTRVGGAMAKRMNADPRPHRERLTELYLRALSRPPTARELTLLEQRLSRGPTSDGVAAGGAAGGMDYSDVLWVLINSREFLFNR